MMVKGSYSLRSYWSVVRIYFTMSGKLCKGRRIKACHFHLVQSDMVGKNGFFFWFFTLELFFTVPVTRNRRKTFFSP
jgi:hypothetical protein